MNKQNVQQKAVKSAETIDDEEISKYEAEAFVIEEELAELEYDLMRENGEFDWDVGEI